MERYKVVDDKMKTVLFETDKGVKAWEFAYKTIMANTENEIFIEVYDDDGTFSHWLDSESIIEDYERK